MRLLLVVLVAVLLACNDALAEVEQIKIAQVSKHCVTGGGNNGRNLRFSDGGQDNAEERVGGVSSFAKKISDKVPLSVKMNWWLEQKKPGDYVKGKLGMKGLTGTALTSHVNYPKLLRYEDKLEKNWMFMRARGGFSTYSLWRELGLDSVTNAADLRRIQNTEEFRKYKRYVSMFDRNVESTKGSGYYMPRFIDKDATKVEMTARVQIWAETGKSDQYVKMMLGLERVSSDKLASKQYYPYYKYFLTLKQQHTS